MTQDIAIRSALVLALMGACLALAGLVNGIERRSALGEVVDLVRVIGPLDRDVATELVAPAVSASKDKDLILKATSHNFRQSHTFHKAWLDAVEARRNTYQFESFLWASTLVTCLLVVWLLVRVRRAL